MINAENYKVLYSSVPVMPKPCHFVSLIYLSLYSQEEEFFFANRFHVPT